MAINLYTDKVYTNDLSQYKVTIENSNCGTISGFYTDDDFKWGYNTQLKAPDINSLGGIFGGGNSKFGELLSNIANKIQNVTRAVGYSSQLSTIKVVDEWENISINVNVTHFAGCYGTPSWSEYIKTINKFGLPVKNGGDSLSSNQWKYNEIGNYLASFYKGTDPKNNRILSTLTLGNFFSGSGFWVTGIDVNAKNIFDETGQPVVWEASYKLDYHKQLDMDTFNLMFKS